jgi:hypothetical protein
LPKSLLVIGILMALGNQATSHGEPRPATPVTWLIFVDDLHIDFRNTGRIREFLKAAAATLMREGDTVVMRTSGPSFLAIGPSSDRAVIDAAIMKVSGAGLQPYAISDLAKDLAGELDVRLTITFSTAATLLETGAEARDRQRAMLYISNGYESERSRALATMFARAAQQAQVMVFAVNAGALAVKPMNDPRVDADSWKQMVAARRATPRSIAEPTGGSAFVDDVNVADTMSRIRTAVSKR